MNVKSKWIRYIFILGVIATIIGAVDPLEGSVVIAAGSILLAVSTYFSRDKYFKLFFSGSVLILIGVSLLWYVSSFGGFDPKSEWWWNLMLIPYPIGWLINIITLIIRAVKKPVQPPDIL